MSVAIIDYGSGNLHSAAKAFERASRSLPEPEPIVVTRDPDQVFRSSRKTSRPCRIAVPGSIRTLRPGSTDRSSPFPGKSGLIWE